MQLLAITNSFYKAFLVTLTSVFYLFFFQKKPFITITSITTKIVILTKISFFSSLSFSILPRLVLTFFKGFRSIIISYIILSIFIANIAIIFTIAIAILSVSTGFIQGNYSSYISYSSYTSYSFIVLSRLVIIIYTSSLSSLVFTILSTFIVKPNHIYYLARLRLLRNIYLIYQAFSNLVFIVFSFYYT